MQHLQNFADEYDILCVTESHLDANLNTMNYHLISFQKPSSGRVVITQGGELLIYLKDDISVERVTDLEIDTDETIWIKVRARGQTFLLCNICVPLFIREHEHVYYT